MLDSRREATPQVNNDPMLAVEAKLAGYQKTLQKVLKRYKNERNSNSGGSNNHSSNGNNRSSGGSKKGKSKFPEELKSKGNLYPGTNQTRMNEMSFLF